MLQVRPARSSAPPHLMVCAGSGCGFSRWRRSVRA